MNVFKRNAIGLLIAAGVVTAPLHAAQAQVRAEQWNSLSAKELQSAIDRQHPAAYFVLAKKLFEEGKKDEAVFWFYAGQLRYRAYLKANPNLNPSGDPALFASLLQVLGQPINGYAFGDIPALAATIDRVLDWDAKNPDSFSAKDGSRDEIRQGLVKMKQEVVTRRDEIRATRKQNGLDNRN